mmetsp:Transcript_87293/g.222397  ORF Transcript_87293/g.222397 Transcript_87293/m.222397 type:complete len:205 (+) Transcript_87293:379-993(+)
MSSHELLVVHGLLLLHLVVVLHLLQVLLVGMRLRCLVLLLMLRLMLLLLLLRIQLVLLHRQCWLRRRRNNGRALNACKHSRPGRDGIQAPGVGERRVHVVEVLHEVGLREWRGLLNLPAPAHEEIGDHLSIGVFVEMRLELDLDVRNGSLCTDRIENGLAHTGVLECHHSAAHGAVFFRMAELTFLDDDLAACVLAAGSPLRLR